MDNNNTTIDELLKELDFLEDLIKQSDWSKNHYENLGTNARIRVEAIKHELEKLGVKF